MPVGEEHVRFLPGDPDGEGGSRPPQPLAGIAVGAHAVNMHHAAPVALHPLRRRIHPRHQNQKEQQKGDDFFHE